MTSVSAVISARDEEDMLEPCLRLLGFCDEIVVLVDAATTDRTEEIARAHADVVERRTFDTFSAQKNAAAALASSEWVLIVDADERFPAPVGREIRATVEADPAAYDAFGIERINVFFGRPMRHGDWPEHQVRLIRRSRLVYRNAVHERLDIDPARIGRLQQPFWHFTHRSIEEGLRKAIIYGRLQADDMVARRAPKVTGRSLARVLFDEFVRRMLHGRGWRDGMPGVIEALFQPFARFCAHVMLWERQQRPSIEERYRQLEAQIAAME